MTEREFFRYFNSARNSSFTNSTDSDPMKIFKAMYGSVSEPKKILVEGRDYEVIE